MTEDQTIPFNDKIWALVCYIPIFNIVSCVICAVKMIGSQFCIFHARQGIILFLLWFLTIIVAFISPIISLLMWGVVIVLHLAGMVFSYQGVMIKIPLLGQLAMKIPNDYIYKFLTSRTPEDINDTTEKKKETNI